MFRADWLAGAITVPYVPTLGAVHPAAISAELFQAVVDLHSGRFLPYDKDQRWFVHKDEAVLAGHTVHSAELTAFTTLARRRGGRISIYHYAPTAPDLVTSRARAAKLAAGHGVYAGRVVWFQHTPPPDGVDCSRVLLAPTGEPGGDPDLPIFRLDECPPDVRATFAEFAQLASDDGMAFLSRCWSEGRTGGPILVALDKGRVVGAIGPMQTLSDPIGVCHLLPPYFAVAPGQRGRGHGRSLWRAAQRWGRDNGAAYQMLQAVPGSPADSLYRSEGLQPLGFMCSVTA